MSNKGKPKRNLVILLTIFIMAITLIYAPQLIFFVLILGIKFIFNSKDQVLKKINSYPDIISNILNYSTFAKKSITNDKRIFDQGDQLKNSAGTAANSTAIFPMDAWVGLLNTGKKTAINKKGKYLQIALNGTLTEAEKIVKSLPLSEKIIIEAGTPLIKIAGIGCVSRLRSISNNAYIVADMKVSDNAEFEVAIAAEAGASAATCLGISTIETIEKFIEACERHKIDSMIDLMNVADPVSLFKKLKKIPKVAIIHRGVDETEKTREKVIPYYQINKIKGAYDVMVAIAGGDDAREVQSAIFNGANIVVVWKNFMQANNEVRTMAQLFLKEFK